MRLPRQAGFTLLEVLIALAIVAMSVGALLGTVTSSASNVSYLQEKTLAEWVALNRLTEIRLDHQNMPEVGRRTGNSVMGGTRWEWEEEVTELPVKGMLRIEVRAHNLQEAVDDTKPVDKPASQTPTPTKSSTDATKNIFWTTSVIGVVSSSRSDVRTPFATAFTGNLQAAGPGGQPNPVNPPKPGGAPSQ
jgi:general secretion pathway protein I